MVQADRSFWRREEPDAQGVLGRIHLLISKLNPSDSLIPTMQEGMNAHSWKLPSEVCFNRFPGFLQAGGKSAATVPQDRLPPLVPSPDTFQLAGEGDFCPVVAVLFLPEMTKPTERADMLLEKGARAKSGFPGPAFSEGLNRG